VVVRTVIPALGMQRQKDHKFPVSMGYVVRPCLKTKQRKRQGRGLGRPNQRPEEGRPDPQRAWSRTGSIKGEVCGMPEEGPGLALSGRGLRGGASRGATLREAPPPEDRVFSNHCLWSRGGVCALVMSGLGIAGVSGK
jgi:hypothetical protein